MGYSLRGALRDAFRMRPGAAGPSPRFDSGGRPIVEFSPEVREALGIGGVPTAYGELYRTQPAVRVCVDFLAVNIAQLKLKVYTKGEDGERTERPDHRLARDLASPSGLISQHDLIRDTVADLAVYGNAYWAKRQVLTRRALVRIPPVFITPRGGSAVAGPTEYRIDVGGGPVDLGADQVVHFKTYNPQDVRVGVSVLDALRSTLEEEAASSLHRRNFWKNAARRDGLIERPAGQHWTEEQREQFRVAWQNAYAGANNAGKTVVLEDGMTWNPDAFSPRESEFIEGREWSLDMVATGYRIPLAVLSRKNTATFASLKEFRTIVYVDVLGTWNALIEDTIATQLVPDYDTPGLYVEFNIDEKLQGDFESQAQAMKGAIQVPWMSVNDGRRKRNEPPIGDPSDPDNPYNWPARPTNFTYGDPETAPAVPPPVRAPLQEAALAAELADIDELERVLEETR